MKSNVLHLIYDTNIRQDDREKCNICYNANFFLFLEKRKLGDTNHRVLISSSKFDLIKMSNFVSGIICPETHYLIKTHKGGKAMKRTKVLWFTTGILFFINLVFYLTKLGGEKVLVYVSDLLPVICSFISSICLIIAIRGFKECDLTKKAWIVIFIGIAISALAELTYCFFEAILGYDMNIYNPSVADYIWSIGYIPLIAGLVMMFLGYKRSGFPMGNPKIYLLIFLSFIALFFIVSHSLLAEIIEDPETKTIQKFFYLYYPIGDIFLFVPSAILMYITQLFKRGTISKPWKYLAIGFLFFTFADLIYSYLSWEDQYGSGNLIDIGWNLGYLFIGLSGVYQRELVETIE
jgi:hypothetical protein